MSDLKQAVQAALGASYSVERELGGGGMSRVFLAQDLPHDRPVVIKVLHSEIAAEVSSERFRREVQLAAKLQHPHIVPLISSGEVEGLPFFLMPYIPGESLRDRLERDGELPIKEAVRILSDVASALSHAHRHGIVHRDIKPENILLSDDFAVVTDFGIAKALSDASASTHQAGLTTHGIALGTAGYMAPEQAAADPNVDQRADIYSFGVVAYEILTGFPIFQGRNAQALFAAHALQRPEPIEQRRPGIPMALAALVMQCLQKRPADRPQTASEIISALESAPTSSGSAPDQRATWLRTASGPTPVTTTRGPLRRWVWIALAAVTFAAIGITGATILEKRKSAAAEDNAAFASIAVLPLANLSGNSEDEYFSEGMTDELANALGKIPNLNVASRTSTYSFKSVKNLDLSEVARKLHVRTVVEGSVRRAGTRLRVYAQLTDVANGFMLWSKTFDGDAGDVFKFQDEIAAAVADALRSRLSLAASGTAADARGTENLRAYDLYLRANYFWHQRGGENLANAVAYFKSAIAEDPKFARAYAGLAIAVALLPEYSPASPEESTKQALDAADRALALDSSLAEAHTAKGLAYVHTWQGDRAAAEYRRAIQLDPRYPTAHQWYGEYWLWKEQIDSGLAQIRRAAELDPLAPINASSLGYTLNQAGRFDEAIRELKKGIELTPNLGQHHSMIANSYYGKGDIDSALREANIALRLDPDIAYRHGQIAFLSGKKGDSARAASELRLLKTKFSSPAVPHFAIMLAYLGVGDRNSALAELGTSVKERELTLVTQFLIREPLLAELRGDPRFLKLVQEARAIQ